MPLVHDNGRAFMPFPESPVPRAATGPLAGLSFAGKDLFDVTGYPTSGGQPLVLAVSGIKTRTAPTVQKLLDAGARFVGRTITDELAFSMNGQNAHFGSPVNGAAPDRITGGSSSGSAAAVSNRLCDMPLGADPTPLPAAPRLLRPIDIWALVEPEVLEAFAAPCAKVEAAFGVAVPTTVVLDSLDAHVLALPPRAGPRSLDRGRRADHALKAAAGPGRGRAFRLVPPDPRPEAGRRPRLPRALSRAHGRTSGDRRRAADTDHARHRTADQRRRSLKPALGSATAGERRLALSQHGWPHPTMRRRTVQSCPPQAGGGR